MNRSIALAFSGLLILVLAACSPAATPTAQATRTPPALPLADPGPYFAGNREATFVDESRDGRTIIVRFYYPAERVLNEYDRPIQVNAAPDLSGAPYPLVLTEGDSGGIVFQSHLATHGFVMASIQIPDHREFYNWDVNMVSWPLDFLFVLRQLVAAPPAGLEGMIDTDRTGVTGYSYGGDISLTLSGARIDPAYYASFCAQPPRIATRYGDAATYHEYTCGLASKWDALTKIAGEAAAGGEDGLWQPITDTRIRAVMPMAPSGAWLYGERGLASVSLPTLMIAATEDEYIPYTEEFAFIYKNLGAPQKDLVSFVGKSHMMALDAEPAARIKHFAVAFFGYHLQGRADYQVYFSQDYVSQFEDLYWGIYPGD